MTKEKELLLAIRHAREEYYRAREMKCTCSDFVLQHENGCQCDSGKKIKACEYELWLIIEGIE